jgi:hypothetical protein
MQAAQSPDRAARINRIRSRGCPEIVQALNRGELGIKTLERISRLPVSKQSIELARCLEVRNAKRERQAAWRADPRRGKAQFASQGYMESRRRRLRRIEGRAITELQAAFNEGRLSLRRYDELSKLSPSRQRQAVMSDRAKEQAQELAAVTIRAVLARKEQRIDLGALAGRIIESIRGDSRDFPRLFLCSTSEFLIRAEPQAFRASG